MAISTPKLAVLVPLIIWVVAVSCLFPSSESREISSPPTFVNATFNGTQINVSGPEKHDHLPRRPELGRTDQYEPECPVLAGTSCSSSSINNNNGSSSSSSSSWVQADCGRDCNNNLCTGCYPSMCQSPCFAGCDCSLLQCVCIRATNS